MITSPGFGGLTSAATVVSGEIMTLIEADILVSD